MYIALLAQCAAVYASLGTVKHILISIHIQLCSKMKSS